ncbi:MAG: PGF-CTERM sorting domain-containing protein [Haloarculaceae archaeon]
MAIVLGSLLGPGVATATVGDHHAAVTGGRYATVTGGRHAAVTGDIQLTERLALTPAKPGEVEARIEFRIPNRVVSMNAQLPASATVVDTSGFTASGARYEWDGHTERPTITVRYPANETTVTTGPGYVPAGTTGPDYANPKTTGSGYATAGTLRTAVDADVAAEHVGSPRTAATAETGLLFADAGDWALVSRLPVSVGFRYRGDPVGLSRSLAVAGEGVAGEQIAFLGDYRTVNRTANGQRFELVIPAAASMRESPSDVLDALATASSSLTVGDRDRRVLAVAAPASVDWAVRGLQTGDADFWVQASESLNRTNSAWFHEYVHTRQDYTPRAGTRWFVEGGATYYATLLALEHDRIPFDQFRAFLGIGHKQYGDAVLADPSNWEGNGNYYKGALVAGDLDRQIRLSTDHASTFQTVFRSMNEHDGNLSQSDFLADVNDAGGSQVAGLARTYTETDGVPDTWDREAHTKAFGDLPARLRYGFATGDAFAVSGSYRNETLADGGPIAVAPGERLTIRTRVANVGGTASSYNASLWLDDRLLAAPTGTVDPGETHVFATNHTFERTGSYTLRTGTETVDVRVVDPAAASVTDVAVDRATLPEPGTVRVTASVRNDASIPALASVTFTLDGQHLRTRDVPVAPGGTRTVTANVTLSTSGTYAVGVVNAGTRTVTVAATSTDKPMTTTSRAVTTGATTPTGGDATPTRGPGFGVGLALVALLSVAAVLAKRQG